MNCRRTRSLLSAYVDSELSGSDMLAIRGHLNRCGDCAAEHQELVSLKRLLSALPDKEPRPEFLCRLQTVAERRPFENAMSCVRPAWFVGAQMALFSPVSAVTGRRLASVCVVGLFGFWFMVAPAANVPAHNLRRHTVMRAVRLLSLVGLTLPYSFTGSSSGTMNPSMIDPAGDPDLSQDRRERLLEARMISETRSYRLRLLTEPYAQSAFAPSSPYAGFGDPTTVYTGYAIASH